MAGPRRGVWSDWPSLGEASASRSPPARTRSCTRWSERSSARSSRSVRNASSPTPSPRSSPLGTVRERPRWPRPEGSPSSGSSTGERAGIPPDLTSGLVAADHQRMEVVLPRSLDEALDVAAGQPDVVPIAGGSDVMVEMNFDLRRPETLLDVSRLPELHELRREDGHVFLGAGVSYTRIMRELPEMTALVQASRSVGSPQIRNRATVGGNLGTASPAGDALPPLAVYEAEVVLVRSGGTTRTVPWREFLARGQAECPRARGADPRHAMAGPERTRLVLEGRDPQRDGDLDRRGVPSGGRGGTHGARGARLGRGDGPSRERGRGSCGRRDELRGRSGRRPTADLDAEVVERFGELVAAAAEPIDDVRGTAAFRRHACGVLSRRALRWALEDRREVEH